MMDSKSRNSWIFPNRLFRVQSPFASTAKNLLLSLLIIFAAQAQANPFASPLSTANPTQQSLVNMLQAMNEYLQTMQAYNAANATNPGFNSWSSQSMWSNSPYYSGFIYDSTKNPPMQTFQSTPSGTTSQAISPENKLGDLKQLNGQWISINGERLEISGKSFRLMSRAGMISGLATSNEDILSFYIPANMQTLLYQVKLANNQMMLRDQRGFVMQFRRVNP